VRASLSDVDLTNGPATLCQAFGISLAHNGLDLTTSTDVYVAEEGTVPSEVVASEHVGIRVGTDLPGRLLVDGDRYGSQAPVSTGRRTSAP
jgi:3-methyladenine DNA glycosylase Mpg